MGMLVPESFADNELAEFIGSYNAMNVPSAADTGAEGVRAATSARIAVRPKGPQMHELHDVRVTPDGPTVRVYRPTAHETGVVVYFHGGG
jgi:acetyl esterase/lipase